MTHPMYTKQQSELRTSRTGKPLNILTVVSLAFSLCWFMVCLPAPVHSQHTDERFVKPGQRLKFDHVVNLGMEAHRPIYQDRHGFLWFGAYGGGLFRYDGYELTQYPPLSGGLSNGTIGGMVADPEHPDVLWIATWGGGLNRFDTATDTFRVYPPTPSPVFTRMHQGPCGLERVAAVWKSLTSTPDSSFIIPNNMGFHQR